MLSRTTSVAAVFTGLIFVAAVALVAGLADYAPHELIPALVLHFLLSFFVAHFALEGYSDEWEQAGRVIPPGQVTIIALRYMTMSLVLLVPLVLVAPWHRAGVATVMTPTLDAVFLLLYVVLVVTVPPALVVVSVSAASWGDLVSIEHWRSRFDGRGGDFFLIYVVFVGALFCVLIAGLPIVSLAGLSSVRALTLSGVALAVFATGFSISLLGRLCGSFAAPEPEAAPEVAPTLHPSLSKFQSAAGGPTTPASDSPPRKTTLIDASARVEELRAKHAGDATALVSALGKIDEEFLPHPAVRHALVMALLSAGRLPDAAAVAREAIPLCIRSGNGGAAALMYEALLAASVPPELSKDQMISLGDTLKGMKHSTAAVDVYARVLRQAPTEVKALKGTIAIAHELAQQKETAAAAVRIYDDLTTICPQSPLLDFIKEERAKASGKA